MSETPAKKEAERKRRRIDATRFGLLAATILTVIVLVMLIEPLMPGRLTLQVLISLPILFGLWVVSGNSSLLVFGIVAAVVSTGLGITSIARGDDFFMMLDLALRAVFLLVVAGWITREVLRQERISTDTLLGGVSVYLILGTVYSLLYVMIGLGDPEAFRASAGDVPITVVGPHSLSGLPTFLYFSFSTLTTAAYGDIVPAAAPARLLAISEGMIGQLFPAVFMARLVGLHVAQRRP